MLKMQTVKTTLLICIFGNIGATIYLLYQCYAKEDKKMVKDDFLTIHGFKVANKAEIEEKILKNKVPVMVYNTIKIKIENAPGTVEAFVPDIHKKITEFRFNIDIIFKKADFIYFKEVDKEIRAFQFKNWLNEAKKIYELKSKKSEEFEKYSKFLESFENKSITDITTIYIFRDQERKTLRICLRDQEFTVALDDKNEIGHFFPKK